LPELPVFQMFFMQTQFKKMNKIILLFVALALTQPIFCQNNNAQQLDELFTFYEKQNLFNGSVLIAKKGQILLNKGFGLH
jgi:hypothetical protein